MTYSFIRLEFLLKTSFGKCFNLLFESVLQQKESQFKLKLWKDNQQLVEKPSSVFNEWVSKKKKPVEKLLIESKTKSISQTPA